MLAHDKLVQNTFGDVKYNSVVLRQIGGLSRKSRYVLQVLFWANNQLPANSFLSAHLKYNRLELIRTLNFFVGHETESEADSQ